ncbi:Inhibitor I29 domain containing protein [Asbolus verrucosus]|uniref:Inhibitor I29 domain containing protein n=1 Tax=Asbolus verrucosus TaxID=1661398 RepID=A0A482VMD5_ASBVE|nr:Inhibitor I29 domain containing protein [Asbolus verrucosus]
MKKESSAMNSELITSVIGPMKKLTKFDKNYPDSKENNRRKQIFVQSLQYVEDHNKKYHEEGLMYKISKFSDWTEEEKRNYQGQDRINPAYDVQTTERDGPIWSLD